MAYLDNRPTLDRLTRMLGGLGAKRLAQVDPLALEELLDASIAWVELEARTAFNGRSRTEDRDGDGGRLLALFRWPSQRILDARVETPILGYTRIYQPDEIKNYPYQGTLQIYTYKMVADTVTGQHLDLASWGTILPPIPQSVHVTYCYGFPQYDPDAQVTTFDGGTTVEDGDTRQPEDRLYLSQLSQAALSDAAASYLAQNEGLQAGIITSVSFDGLSRSMNPQAYGAQVQALIEKRDELMVRRKRPFIALAGT